MDRKACSGTNERILARPLDSRHEAATNLTGTFDQHKKYDKSSGWKSEDQHIPGLHFYNSGITINIQEGTLANPILIQDDCSVKLEEESSISYKGHQEEASTIAAVDSDMSMPDTDISNSMENTLTFEAPKASASGPSNVEGVGAGSNDKHNGDKLAEVSHCLYQKASSRSATSSSFSSSSTSSSESENEDAHLLPATKPSTDSHSSQCACSAHEGLRSLDWKNSRSILFIKNLAQASRVDDVFEYLQLNGFLSSEYVSLMHLIYIYLNLTSILIGFVTFDYIDVR